MLAAIKLTPGSASLLRASASAETAALFEPPVRPRAKAASLRTRSLGSLRKSTINRGTATLAAAPRTPSSEAAVHRFFALLASSSATKSGIDSLESGGDSWKEICTNDQHATTVRYIGGPP